MSLFEAHTIRRIAVVGLLCAAIQGVSEPMPRFADGHFTVCAWVKTSHGGTIFSRCAPEGRWSRGGKALFIDDGVLVYDIGGRGGLREDAHHRQPLASRGLYGSSPAAGRQIRVGP